MNQEEGKLKSSYSLRPKANESEAIKKFLMKQSSFSESIRYLIEKEIRENGIRDLAEYIPMKRNTEDLDRLVHGQDVIRYTTNDENVIPHTTSDNNVIQSISSSNNVQEVESRNKIDKNTINEANTETMKKDDISETVKETVSDDKDKGEVSVTKEEEEIISKKYSLPPEEEEVPDCYS